MSRVRAWLAHVDRALCAMRGHVDLPTREGDRLAWGCTDCGRVAPTDVPVLPFAPEAVRDWQ